MRRPVLPQDESVRSEWIDWKNVAQKTAVVSGVFCLVLFILLIINHINLNNGEVTDSPVLISLKQQLRESPSDQNIKDIIRDTDATLRQQYFSRYHKQNTGGIVLTVALAIFFLSMRIAWLNKPLPPEPGPDPHKAEEHRYELFMGRRAVWGLVIFMCCSTIALANYVPQGVPNYVDPEQAAKEAAGPIKPTWDVLAQQWPLFRGPGANAVVTVPGLAQKWSNTENIRWHEKISLPGLNSPIIWDDRLYVTGALKTQRYVYCLNIKNGKTMWKKQVKDVPFSPEEHPHVEESFTGYAAPTMACDGNAVYAIFANGDLVALTMDGDPLWSLNVGIEGNMYGFSASLTMHEHLLYVQIDQDEAAYVAAINTADGKTVWEKDRDYGGCWASPSIVKFGDNFQLVVMGNPDVISYDPLTGDELWKRELMSGDVAPTPIFANDITYVVNMACPLTAINEQGEILWKNEEGSWPDTSSPVTDGKYIWLLDSGGVFTCVSCADGKTVYEERIDGAFTTSPTVINDEILIVDEEGKVYVIANTDSYTLKRTFDSKIPMKASPSFDKKGNMYLRSGKDIYCIGVP